MSLTEVEHAAAIRAYLDTALVGATVSWHAYDYDDVPDQLPANYAVISVTRRYADDFRFSYGRRLVGYRLSTLAVGITIDSTRWVRDRMTTALADRPLTLNGQPTTPVRFESENPIEWDDGRYSGSTFWTYAL